MTPATTAAGRARWAVRLVMVVGLVVDAVIHFAWHPAGTLTAGPRP